MARPNKTEQEHGYLKAFWTEIKTMEADYVGMVVFLSYPISRPGVFVFRLTFTPLLTEVENPLGTCAVQIEFPNSSTQTLAGALWSASMKLTTLVFDADRARRGLPR